MKLDIIIQLSLCIAILLIFLGGLFKGIKEGRKEILELNVEHHLMYYKDGKYYYQPEFRLAGEKGEYYE